MDLVGIEIKEEGKKKRRRKEEKKKEKKKELSPESNLGPLILRDSGRYAYNSEGVAGRYSKRAWGEHCLSSLLLTAVVWTGRIVVTSNFIWT